MPERFELFLDQEGMTIGDRSGFMLRSLLVEQGKFVIVISISHFIDTVLHSTLVRRPSDSLPLHTWCKEPTAARTTDCQEQTHRTIVLDKRCPNKKAYGYSGLNAFRCRRWIWNWPVEKFSVAYIASQRRTLSQYFVARSLSRRSYLLMDKKISIITIWILPRFVYHSMHAG